ncbi:hypothetical protein Mth01_48240 [Sphaerimonospora thailandensis]|uniref:Uncharacterized protein n=1 Tax=Sphaerimonospora thailandensis TaxID=795644 RepID=A0A8J3W2A0_9ACTN|nr:hypothetical protein Mth01_48240 [Sphaerimonospora thailandensis]
MFCAARSVAFVLSNSASWARSTASRASGVLRSTLPNCEPKSSYVLEDGHTCAQAARDFNLVAETIRNRVNVEQERRKARLLRHLPCLPGSQEP